MMEHFLTIDDDVKLSYRVLGSGARDVFLIHGWMVSGAVYHDLIDVLDASGLRLVLIDQRGSGASSKPAGGYTIERYAADILAVADAVGSKTFVAVGNSMGGLIAQWLAVTQPQRIAGLLLLCPVPASGVPLPEEARRLFRGSAGNRSAQGTILGLACKELSPAARERMLDDAATVAAPCIEQAFDAWTAGGFAERLSSIKAPTLVVATDDPFMPPAFLKASVVEPIAGARLAVLPGPGHYVQVERPRETAALLQAFLAGLGS
jgi:pimeloyl-ACP methyl ester carboxylesterase